MNRAAALTALALLSACGSYDPADGPTVTESQTLTGTTQAIGPLSCGGDSHSFTAADGAIVVTLVQSTGSVGLAAQVCAGSVDDNNCSINLGPIAVGETRTGTRRGIPQQTLKLLTANCGGGGPAPAAPVQYTATVTYQR